MNHEAQELRIRELAARVLAAGDVSVVIGFRRQEETGRSVPFIAHDEAECARLVWNEACDFNLGSYLENLPESAVSTESSPSGSGSAASSGAGSDAAPGAGIGAPRGSGIRRVALVMKPCDVRLAVNLMAEGRLERNRIVIIGVACNGMLHDGKTPAACRVCAVHTPPVCDHFVDAEGSGGKAGAPPDVSGKGVDAEGRVDGGCEAEAVEAAAVMGLPPAQRLKRLAKELEKCILCFACRQACAGCYCATCFMDRGGADWLTTAPSQGLGDRMTFHLTRMMHLAGRCVGCGACEKACPSGVDLSFIRSALRAFIRETYGFEAGMDPEAHQVMNSYAADDRQIGFLGEE